jgi:hypothetical protein
MSQRTKADYGHWIVPRQSQVHLARKEYYDLDTRLTNAALYVAVNEEGVAYGFRVGRPDGKKKAKSSWSALLAAMGDDQKLRRALRAAMKKHELSLDVYAEETSYGQVGQIVVQERGFQWQHETADQEITRKMNWKDLVEYLQTVGPKKRCDLRLCRRLSAESALELGTAATSEIDSLFEALVPVYNASVGA